MTTLTEGVAGAGSAAPQTPVRAGRRRSGAWRFAVLVVLGAVLPRPDRRLGAVHRARPRPGGVTLRALRRASPAPRASPTRSPGRWPWPALTVVIVLLLMVPTVVLVDLRLPRLRTTVELLTLLPLVLPPIALVVGVRSVLSWAPDYFLNTPLAEAFFALQKPSLPWILVLVYVVLALPFVYRALDAGVRGADLRTLTEAGPQPRRLAGRGCSSPSSCRSCARRCSTPRSSPSRWCSASTPSPPSSGFETFPTWIVRISGLAARSCRWRSRCSP